MSSGREAAPLLPLVGQDATVLHADEESRDIDCAARGIDPLWPLRLPSPWRLCRLVRYDGSRGYYYLLEREGRLLALDLLEDPRALGRYGFPTSIALDGGVSPGVHAAYVLAKRVQRGVLGGAEWSRIRARAVDDREAYSRAVERVFGRRTGRRLAAALVHDALDPRLLRVARRAQRLRRRARIAAAPSAWADPLRQAARLLRRSGLHVVLVGPDGSGKSALAEALPRELDSLFAAVHHRHWRPQLLPAPGALLRRQPAPAMPHERTRHRRLLSLALLVYYWLDFAAGGWLWLRPLTLRQRLVLIERGWADLEVDRTRYRLAVPSRLIRALGRALPRPDLVLALEAEPEQIASRKGELDAGEIARQQAEWRRRLDGRDDAVFVDAGRPLLEVVAQAREAIVSELENRALARLGGGWARVPRRGAPRWWLPRAPRAAARAGLFVHQPTALHGRLLWRAARVLVWAGLFRCLPRAEPPPRALREKVAVRLPRRGTLATARSSHAGRFVAALVDTSGRMFAMAKLALEPSGCDALAREARNISALGPLLPAPLAPPRVLGSSDGLLLLEGVGWRLRRRPDRLPLEVAAALGQFFAARGRGALRGPTHGDFAPWNLLQTAGGWVLVDWESARPDGEPFFDLFHYLVQSHVFFGRPSPEALIAGVSRGKGDVGKLVRVYAEEAGLPPEHAPRSFRVYLQTTNAAVEALGPGGRSALTVRRELTRRFDSAAGRMPDRA